MSKLNRTRIVCISDTHNTFPKLPAGDVLVHAGDLTNQGSLSELQRALRWLETTQFEAKIVVAGNHDVTLDKDFYQQHSSSFHNQAPQDSRECKDLLLNSSIHYLEHESATISLSDPNGPRTRFKVFGSPFSPCHGLWAFGYQPEDGFDVWKQIPLDTDVVVTHTPPKYHRDEHSERGATGCEALREALWRVRPFLHVCGHVHEGRGAETIFWDVEASHVKVKERGVLPWHDTTIGTNKQFKIDLTGRRLAVRAELEKSLSHPAGSSPVHLSTDPGHSSFISRDQGKAKGNVQWSGGSQASEASMRNDLEWKDNIENMPLDSRLRRTETCIVNAAHIGTNWPHKQGKKINKPIVVDLLLPVAN